MWKLQFAVLALAIFAVTCQFRSRILVGLRNGTLISDPEGHSLTMFYGRAWLAYFSPSWRHRYGSTWAFGIGRERVWYYYPKGVPDDAASD